MKPSARLLSFLCVASTALLTVSYAHANTLYWDGATPTGAPGGGAGTWDTSTTNWDTSLAGADVAWDNTNTLLNPLDIAVFGGTASTAVNLGSNISVGGINFDTTGYTINTGANTLTLGATNTTISLGSVAAATITGTITGTNLILSGNPTVAGTLTLNSTGTGWTGTTTVNAGRTLLIGQTSQALASTSSIAINGGTIRLDRANDAIAGNQIADGAAITFNGGGSLLIRHNTAMSGKTENIGAVTVASGQANFDLSNGTSSGGNSVVLTSLTRSVNTAAVTFANGGYGSNQNNMLFKVSGAADTTAGQIIGPWATYGASAASQNDYAIYSSGDGTVTGAGIAASAETTWTTAANAYTHDLGITATGTTLTATRNVAALRTIGTGLTSVDIATETITLTGHTFSNGDQVVFGTGAPAGLTAGTTYFVVGTAANTFKVSTTSGGAAVNLTGIGTLPEVKLLSTPTTLTLASGANLGTLGILNGSGYAMTIAPGTDGVVTLPSATSANLFVTAGRSAITISAAIQDNGAGVLSLVKGGSSTLTLSGANTYTGGTVINAGTLTFSSLTAGMDGTGKNITFGGTGTLDTGVNGWDGGQLTVSAGAVGTIAARTVDFTSTTGSGAIIQASGNAVLNLGNASTFTGSIRKDAGGDGGAVQFSALSDASGAGNLIFAGGSANSNQRITMRYLGTSALTFDNRSIELLPKPNNWSFRNAILENNSANTAHTWVINTDLINQTDRDVEFTLSGSNTGNNEFAGVISNTARGTLYASPLPAQTGALSLYKAGTGKWIVSGANTFTGLVIVSQGTLSVANINESNVAGALGMNNTIQLGGAEPTGGTAYLGGNNSGTLEYTGNGQTSTRTFRIGDNVTAGNTGGGGISNNGTGALTFSAANFNTAVATATGNRILTLGGSNTGNNSITGIIQDNGSGTGRIGLIKNDVGSWSLSGANTYSSTNTVNLGTLKGTQTTGTPFGTGAVTIGAGTLSLAPSGSGSAVSLTGGTVASDTLFTYNADSILSLNKGTQTSLTYTFGGTGATTTRGANGTLILSTSDIANFGTAGSKTERFIMNGTAPTQVNTLVSGVVIQDRNSGNAGDFAAYNGTDGYTKATYTLTDDFTGSTNVSSVEIANATATGTIAAYALKVSGATVTNSGTISLGSATNPVAGLILNGGTISGGILTTPTSSATEFSIYTSGISEISSQITTQTSQAGMSVFGPGTLALTSGSANGFTGGLRINNSTVIATDNNQLGQAASAITLTGGTLQTSGTFALGGAGQRAITLAAGQDQTGGTFNVTGGTTTYQNASASSKFMSGTGSLTKIGTGTLALTGNTPNTYTGATNINGGLWDVGSGGVVASINSTSAITVAAGAKFAYNSSTALTVAPTLNGTGTGAGQRAVLGGTGPINTAVTLDNLGDVLSPGNSPGIQTYTPAQTWSSFSYDWEVNNFTGTTAGTDFDLLNLASTLNLSGGASAYQLNVLGLTAGDISGLVPNFSEVNRSWTILSSTGITGFNPAYWTINTTGFTDPDAGTWSLAQSGNDLVLTYAVVPEPRAALLGALGVLALLRRRR